jgi:hypothetical protein
MWSLPVTQRIGFERKGNSASKPAGSVPPFPLRL